MTKRRLRQAIAFASLAIVLVAAAVSTSDRWTLDFAQYKGEPRPQAKDEFRFVIVGDRTGGAQWGLMPQTFREINQLDPDFVISVGDIIDGGGSDEETIDGIWDYFDRSEMSVLKVPFVYMPGNHDIWSATSKKVYEQRYGPSFKSFNYRGLHFITLNTQESAGNDYRFRGRGAEALGDEQLKWLKEDIERNRHARRILIFMHQPIWSVLEPVYPMLEGLKVNVFAGHYHKYSYQEIHGIPHIICSATAAYMPEEGMEGYGRFRSYLMATVRDDDLKLALIRLGGVLNPKFIMEQDQSGIRRLTDACAIRRDGDGPAAPTRIVFRNPMPMPVRLQIVKATRGSNKHLFDGDEPTVAAGDLLKREVDWQSFAGRGAGEYRVVYRFENSGGELQSVDFPIEAKVHRAVAARAISAPPEIDGDLSDWSGASWQSVADGSQVSFGIDAWGGPQDLSAQFAVAQDNLNFYVAVRVTDDTVAYSSAPFDGDGVELYLANSGEREISFSTEPDWLGLVVAPFASSESSAGPTAGPARLRKIGQRNIWGSNARTEEFAAARAAYVRDAKQYAVELAIPRATLGWNSPGGAVARFDVAINDRDSDSNCETKVTWAGTDRNGYSSRYYGEVRIAQP